MTIKDAKIVQRKLGEGLETSRTDWNKVSKLSNSEIDCSDIPDRGIDFWDDAKLVQPVDKQQITIRLDRDLIIWLKSQGKGYQTKINAILRTYYESNEVKNNFYPKN